MSVAGTVLTCLLSFGGYWLYSLSPIPPSVKVPTEVECRCVVEIVLDSIQSEIVGVLKKQLDRCGPDQQTCAACPAPHPCPECPACPISVPLHAIDFNAAMLASFCLGMFSRCSSLGCCVRPLVFPRTRVRETPQAVESAERAPVSHTPMPPAIKDFGPATRPRVLPAGGAPSRARGWVNAGPSSICLRP